MSNSKLYLLTLNYVHWLLIYHKIKYGRDVAKTAGGSRDLAPDHDRGNQCREPEHPLGFELANG